MAIKDREIFCKGKVEPEERHHQKENSQVIEVDGFQIGFEMIESPDQGHRQDEGGNPRKDGARDEVGTEDSAVPHGLDGHGKDKGYDGVDGYSDRNDKNGHERDGLSRRWCCLSDPFQPRARIW